MWSIAQRQNADSDAEAEEIFESFKEAVLKPDGNS